MLDDFKDKQKIAYKILTNAVKYNTYSHAYLIESNGNKDAFDLALAFAKALLCPNNHMKHTDCNICDKIDKNIYSELTIIESDGMWIKKEQLLDLQKSVKNKGVESDKKIYIIKNAERLNDASENSILKFLEEPNDNIIAILITNNIHQLLDTIISRCQVISLATNNINEYENQNEKILNYLNEKYDLDSINKMIETTLDYIYFLEKKHLNTIIYNKKMVLDLFSDRKELETFFDIMLLLYKDAVNFKILNKTNIFDEKDVKHISNNNEINALNKKINIINNIKKYIKINANTNLLLDKLVMDIEGEVYE